MIGHLLCRLGLHRRYLAQRNYDANNRVTFWIRMCRRHCGWADAGPNYKR